MTKKKTAAPTYDEIIAQIKTHYSRNVEAHFELAKLFIAAKEFHNLKTIATDASVSIATITGHTTAFDFWGADRIKGDKVRWSNYIRIACLSYDYLVHNDIRNEILESENGDVVARDIIKHYTSPKPTGAVVSGLVRGLERYSVKVTSYGNLEFFDAEKKQIAQNLRDLLDAYAAYGIKPAKAVKI